MHGGEHIGFVQRDAVAEVIVLHIQRGDIEGVGRDVHGVHGGVRVGHREQDGEAAGAGADIRDGGDGLGVGQPLVELLRDDFQEV